MDKAATSRTLSELVEKGYVYYPDAEGSKKYRASVMLTEKGVAVTEQIDKIICDVVEEIGSDLSEEERENMYHALNVISGNLDRMGKRL